MIQQWQVGPAEQMVFEVAQSRASSLTSEQNQELLEGRGSWGGVGKITGKENKNLKVPAVDLADNKESQTG